jgi:hypothetical protein
MRHRRWGGIAMSNDWIAIVSWTAIVSVVVIVDVVFLMTYWPWWRRRRDDQ